MMMMMMMKMCTRECVTAGLLFFMCVCLNQQMLEACSCASAHPQQLFCSADAVLRAEITGEKIRRREDINPMYGLGKIQYEVQVIKVFKGSDRIKDLQHVYTHEMSSMCGIRLNRGQYLLSGSMMSEGFFVTLCDFVEHWDRLSLTQKKNLKYRYQMGCNCTISICTEQPCHPKVKNECILTDWSSLWPFEDGEPVHEYACIRHSDGSCSWHEGGTSVPSEKNTTDISEG
nr:metalloproteinase inhibitor 2-like [Danio rerio]|eukprot:XP_005172816.1 metalloproteinase inhibitor 2-like [Danio rerio]